MIGRLRLGGLAATAALLGAGGYAAAAPASAAASGPYVCSGTLSSPGVLAGKFGNVEVSGFCAVNGGPATVYGDLTVRAGGALVAAFALNDVTGHGTSNLIVDGSLHIDRGGAMVLGCLPTSFPCIDDPDPNNPTLSSHDRIGHDLTSYRPLGVVVHNTRIGGSVSETGGGGGFNCNPTGVFAAFGSPVYSDYEDMDIVGGLSVDHLTSCWLGVARVHLGGGLRIVNDRLNDPDAIEIIANNVGQNLVCRGDTMTWDSADLTENLFPREPEPNIVHGKRFGQCVLSSPLKPGGRRGPGPF